MMKLNWGNSLILFFIIFFVFMFSFVFFAVHQNNDLVTEDYYQKGASYSTQIEVNKRSAVYQDSLQINPLKDRVEITLCKSLAALNDTVHLYFYRSSDQKMDQKFSFYKAGEKLVPGGIKLERGRYQLFVNWKTNGDDYSVQKTIDIE